MQEFTERVEKAVKQSNLLLILEKEKENTRKYSPKLSIFYYCKHSKKLQNNAFYCLVTNVKTKLLIPCTACSLFDTNGKSLSNVTFLSLFVLRKLITKFPWRPSLYSKFVISGGLILVARRAIQLYIEISGTNPLKRI